MEPTEHIDISNAQIIQPPTAQPHELDIHQLSLQMFMGKTQYKKYLAKSNPQTFRETQRNHAPYIQHEPKIRVLMNDMLRAYVHPETHSMPTGMDSNVVDAFTMFVDKAVYHYDKVRATEEYQLPPKNNGEGEEDDEVMFDPSRETQGTSGSVWGKPVTKKGYTRPITNTLDTYLRKNINK